MSKILFLFFLLNFFSSFSLNQNLSNLPTLRLTLNANNLGDIEKYVIEKLLTEREIPIGSIVVSEEVDFLGKLDLVLNNTIIKITNMTDADIFLSFVEKKNVNFILNIYDGEISFDYLFYTGLISGTGNGTINLNNVSLSLNNTIIQVPNEHEPEKMGPGIEIKGVIFNELDMNLSFSKNGTLEKSLKFFNKNLKTIILKVAENELNKKDVRKSINEMLYNLFKNISLNIPIENILQVEQNINISFSMNEEPIIKNNSIEISLEAELKGDHYLYNSTNNISLPHIINNTTLFTEKTINGIISQFILNNVLDYIYTLGLLNFEITNDTIGTSELNVGTISAIIPEITKGYKSNQKAKIITKAIDNPILKINDNNKLNLKLFENLKFFVYNETEYLNEDIGTIGVDGDSEIEIDANFIFNDTNIQLTLASVSMITFEVKNSLVGEIDTDRVISNFKTFMTFMIGSINNNIQKLIDDLPKPFNFEDFNLNELVVKSYENCLKFDLSPTLNLTKLFML